MFSYINETFLQFSEFSKSSPIISGIVSLWGLGVVTFLLKEVPAKMWKFICRQFTVRVSINNADESFLNLVEWYEKEGFSSKCRSLRLTNEYHTDKVKRVLSAGYGQHFFFHKGLPFKLVRTKEEGGLNRNPKEFIELITVGRSQRPIRELLNSTDPKRDASKITKIYKWDSSECWRLAHDQVVRSFESVVLEEENKKKILSHLKAFKESKDWYHGHGIPYRTGVCLYGPPGTGKTSLVRSICGLEERDLYIINLNEMSDRTIELAIESIGQNSVVLIEDIDTFNTSAKRSEKPEEDDKEEEFKRLTLSGLLNSIDGVACSSGRLLIITTNRLECLDKALLRPGRIDLKLELGYLTEETLKVALKRFYPEIELPKSKMRSPISPAMLQSLVCERKFEPAEVLKILYEDDYDQVDNTVLR